MMPELPIRFERITAESAHGQPAPFSADLHCIPQRRRNHQSMCDGVPELPPPTLCFPQIPHIHLP